MDSKIALAVMTKAKLVFEREDTFLSFPLSPVAFTPEQLAFGSSGIATNQDVLDLSDFSRLVNLMPDGTIWPPSAARSLSNRYRDTVHGPVRLAQSTQTAEEDVAFEAAYALLHLPSVDGVVRDSQRYGEYKRCRDALICAQEDYNSRKISADLCDDPEAKQRWTQTEEPLLRAKLGALQQDWETTGGKAQVDAAVLTISALGAKAPTALWDKWGQLFVEELDTNTDTNGNQFAPCGFAPANALTVGAWSQFSMGGTEAATLIGQAPPELRARLAPDSVDLAIDSLSVEFTTVAVTRPWFASDLFAARFWRFMDDSRQLSDGGAPPIGELPAYVAALVFARHLEVRPRAAGSLNDAALNRISAGRAVNLGWIKLGAISTVEHAPGAPILLSAPVRAPLPRDPSPPAIAPRIIATTAIHPTTPLTNIRAAVGGLAAGTTPAMVRASGTIMLDRSRLNGFTRDVVAPGTIAIPPAVARPSPQTQPSDDPEAIYVMAFICKKVQLCPDPDTALKW